MVILEYLDKVRSYPEERRRRILIVSTTGLTVLIIVAWFLNLWLLGAGTGPSLALPSTDSMIEKAGNEWQRIKAGAEVLAEKVEALIK